MSGSWSLPRHSASLACFLLSLAAVALGCSLFTGPELSIGFEVFASQRNGVLADETATAQAETQSIVVDGTMFTPASCAPPTVGGELDGDALTLTLAWTARDRNCLDISMLYTYRAVIQDLAPGVYDLRLVHDNSSPEAFPARTVFEGRVEVR